MVELVFPKVDGEVFYASEANTATEIVNLVAGENLTVGNIVYIKKSDGKPYKSDTGTADDIRADGIVLNTVNAAGTAYVMRKGIYATSGLTTGEVYYLGAAGAISTTFSGVEVGYAESTTKLFVCIKQDDKVAVGTVKAYVKTLAGIPNNNITAHWVECNGQVLADAESALNGQTIPNLNNSGGGAANRLLRGAAASGGTGSETYLPSHVHGLSYDVSSNNGLNTVAGAAQFNTKWCQATTAGTALTYYDVVWIIKIK